MSTRAAWFALDTNAYAEILRGTPAGDRLRALATRERSRLIVLLPVMSELLQRAATPAYRTTVVERFLTPVPEQRRVAPAPSDWIATGTWVGQLAASGHDPEELRRRNFYVDLHVAVVCRARGIALVTADADHERLRVHVGHTTRPFP